MQQHQFRAVGEAGSDWEPVIANLVERRFKPKVIKLLPEEGVLIFSIAVAADAETLAEIFEKINIKLERLP